jgi:uncharacterized protein (DUF1330 family)
LWPRVKFLSLSFRIAANGLRDFARAVCSNPGMTVHRRTVMPAYWVARSKINDPAEYKKYTDLVPAIIAKYGGKVLARGGRFQILEGPQKFHRFVVIEFPSFDQGVACFQSDEYNKAAAFRRDNGAGEVETIMVDGGDATK